MAVGVECLGIDVENLMYFFSLCRSDWKIMLWVIELPILWGIKQCLRCMYYVCVDVCLRSTIYIFCCWDCTHTHTHTYDPQTNHAVRHCKKKHAIKFNHMLLFYFSFDENLKKGRIEKKRNAPIGSMGLVYLPTNLHETLQSKSTIHGSVNIPSHGML